MSNSTAQFLESTFGLKHAPSLQPEEFVRHHKRGHYSVNKSQHIIGLNFFGMDIQDQAIQALFQQVDLTHLQSLNLGATSLTHLHFTSSLPALQYLDISECASLTQLSFEEPLAALVKLEGFDSALHSFTLIRGFEVLAHLDLKNNQLSSLTFEGDFPNLKWLDVSANQLTEFQIPKKFAALEHLFLNDNQLTQLSVYRPLPNLHTLHLKGNQLSSLPENLLLYTKLESLYLHGNPLNGIPQEVIENNEYKSSWQGIQSYLRAQQKSRLLFLHEAKMVLVGNGEVGKTSIRLRLLDKTARLPTREERTQGLEVAHYEIHGLEPELTHLDTPVDFDLNIWDFGGQGKYREIQQLFCSRKTLYVFVTAYDDHPTKDQYIGFEYWLAMVNAYSFDPRESSHCPILHIVNKIDEKTPAINERNRREIFPNIASEDFLKISAKTLYNFEELEQAIRRALPRISSDIFTTPYTENWLAVKRELESLRDQHHISHQAYLAICQQHDLDEQEAATWLEILSRIGTVIYFGQNERLKDWVILNPNWIREVLYQMLDSNAIVYGILRENALSHIWPSYEAEDHQRFLKLMQEYQLCYERKDRYNKSEYVVPACLPEDPPSLPEEIFQSPKYSLKFEFQPFLPAGTINKLMVTLQQGNFQGKEQLLSTGRTEKTLNVKVYENLMWKNNVVVQAPDLEHNTYAHLQESWEDKSVYVSIYGSGAKAMFDFVEEALNQHNQTLKETKYLQQLNLCPFAWHEEEWEMLSTLQKYKVPFFTPFPSHAIPKTPMDRIQALIAQGRLKEALAELSQFSNIHNEVAQLQGRLAELASEEMMGTISRSEASLEKNKLVSAALKLNESQRQSKGVETPPTPPIETPPAAPVSPSGVPRDAKIYLSYAWGTNEETGEDRVEMVDRLYDSLSQDGFTVLRDNMNIQYGDLISKFMNDLGKGDVIVVFMSDKYLRSVYCMWEMCEIYRTSKSEKAGFVQRILPFRIEQLSLNRPQTLGKYLTHWNTEFKEWDTFFQEFREQVGGPQWEEFQKAKKIKNTFAEVVGHFQDMNAQTKELLAENDFEVVKQAILDRIQRLNTSST